MPATKTAADWTRTEAKNVIVYTSERFTSDTYMSLDGGVTWTHERRIPARNFFKVWDGLSLAHVMARVAG